MGPHPANFDRKQGLALLPPLLPSEYPEGIVLVVTPGIWWIYVLSNPMPVA